MHSVDTTDIPFIDEEGMNVPEDVPSTLIKFDERDGKWRLILLTVGLMYKLQKVLDDPWYDVKHIFIQEISTKMKLVETFAWYWHYLFKVTIDCSK